MSAERPVRKGASSVQALYPGHGPGKGVSYKNGHAASEGFCAARSRRPRQPPGIGLEARLLVMNADRVENSRPKLARIWPAS